MKKISSNIGRKLAKYECIQINRLVKNYGVEIVYDAANESCLKEGYGWYLQIKDMCDHLFEFKDSKKDTVKDLVNAKKFGPNKMEQLKNIM